VILVAGSLHLDVIVDAPHLPREDETVTGRAVAYAFGGKGGNQAIAAARMGARVAMAGRVGDDAFAARLLAGLAEAGVDATRVQRGTGASGMSVAITLPGGGYGAVIVSAANLAIDAAAVALPGGLRWLVLQNEIPEAVNIALAQRARAAGARVILNAAPARSMAPALLAATDVLVVNRVEAADLTGPDLAPEAAAAALAARGPGAVIVTLGAEGLVLWDSASRRAPAHAVAAVSTHGAGDMFVGALAAALDSSATLAEAAAFGQAAAALHVAAPVAERAAIAPAAVRALAARAP
jgi:ribokinase